MSTHSEPVLPRRSQRLREKEKVTLINFHTEKLNDLENELTQKFQHVDSLMKDTSNAEIVRKELSLVDNIFFDISYNHQKFTALVDDPTTFETVWLEDIDRRILQFESFVTRWFRSIEIPDELNETNGSGSRKGSDSGKRSVKKALSFHSGKSSSSSSSRSSTASKLIEAEATLAAVEAESKFERIQEVRDPAKEKGLAKEIIKQEARVKVYRSHCESDKKSVKLVVDHTEKKKLSALSVPFFPKNAKRESSFSTTPLLKPVVSESSADTLCDLLKLQSAPEVSLDVFNGDPLEFHFFMSCFENVVESKVNDRKGKLILLIKYTSGEAKDLIKGCVHRTDDCYDYAKGC